ncbi:MAG: acyltransferase [Acidobacteriia bacterium]|nr:acyltransferase [Terriglobia bacterium]
MTPASATGDRYRTLDAWRALAAMAVVVFHCTNAVVRPEMGWWARALLSGWAGVFVFFPISGYCILAAVCRAQNATLGHFLTRRWRRIAPPYWASIAVTLAVAVAAAPFNRGSLGDYQIGVTRWLSVVTLTQVWFGAGALINPVYWSLCYEEQFYLVMGLTLLAPGCYRLRLLMGVTILSGLYHFAQWPAGLRVEGLFLAYWLEFSCGLAAFVWIRRPAQRAWAATVFVIVAIAIAASGSVGLMISAAAAVAFIALSKYDAAIAATGAGAALMSVGAFSYSLYLIHVPIGGRIVNGLHRLPLPLLVPTLFAIPGSLVAGWCFYAAIERRFLNPGTTLPS